MTNRSEAIELYRSAKALWDKAHFNAGKVRFLSYTKAGVFAYEQYGDQLKAMFTEAGEASKRFALAVSGAPTEEIVSIIEEAGA